MRCIISRGNLIKQQKRIKKNHQESPKGGRSCALSMNINRVIFIFIFIFIYFPTLSLISEQNYLQMLEQ